MMKDSRCVSRAYYCRTREAGTPLRSRERPPRNSTPVSESWGHFVSPLPVKFSTQTFRGARGRLPENLCQILGARRPSPGAPKSCAFGGARGGAILAQKGPKRAPRGAPQGPQGPPPFRARKGPEKGGPPGGPPQGRPPKLAQNMRLFALIKV